MEINTKNEFAWYSKGRSLLKEGNNEAARKAFKTAIELNPINHKDFETAEQLCQFRFHDIPLVVDKQSMLSIERAIQ